MVKAGDKVQWLSRTSPRETRINRVLKVNKDTVILAFPQGRGQIAKGTLNKKYIIKKV